MDQIGIEHGDREALAVEEPFPGVVRRSFSGANATFTSYDFQPGARFPVHRHDSEQLTLVHGGSITFALGDSEVELAAGAWSVVAPGVPHGITAGPDGASVVAVVSPRRDASNPYEVL